MTFDLEVRGSFGLGLPHRLGSWLFGICSRLFGICSGRLGLGVVAVILVALQVRYRWIEKSIEAIPRWWKSGKVFLAEVKGEWGKVTKPSKNEVIQTTIVVVVVSVIFAIYLWASDQVILKAYQWTFESLGL